MKENILNAKNYYDDYEYRGWDLNLMYQRISTMDISEKNLEQIRTKEKAKLLILGSATPNNLSIIAKIDSFLRPGKVEQDTAIIIDQNKYPLDKHKKEILFLEGKDGWTNTPKSTPEFPLPQYKLVQADMRKLPFGKNEIDIVISDYTFNYLDKAEDVNQVFKEISSVLSPNGILLISVLGNENYSYEENMDSSVTDLNKKEQGKVQINCFPLHVYLDLAKKNGLEIIDTNDIGKDLCSILVKKKE